MAEQAANTQRVRLVRQQRSKLSREESLKRMEAFSERKKQFIAKIMHPLDRI
jgi:hypothetical protein